MATVYRKTYTKPLPEGAELLTRKGVPSARWKGAKGKTRTAKVTTGTDGSPRLLIEAGTFTAKYRDGVGALREVATGCRDGQAARGVLHQLLARAQSVRGGYVTAEQDRIADHQQTSLAEHFDAYIQHVASKDTTAGHRRTTRSYLDRLAADCSWSRLVDLQRDGLERWLVARAKEGMSARSRNAYRCAAVSFVSWCVGAKRLAVSPFAGIAKANEKSDPRRQRRALTAEELRLLLDVAHRRPLLDRMTIRRGERKGETVAKLRPETVASLERLGRERALIYKALVLTGLRRGELASLTVGDLELDAEHPHAVLQAAAEKNRQGSGIALRADLVADLRQWLAEKLKTEQAAARAAGTPLPRALSPGTPLFTVPTALVKILDRDLVMAGIARKVVDKRTGKSRIDKRDDRGRSIDVHALRHSFGTHLSMGGVPLRTAQAAMRHSDPSLTANVYTDPRLLDVAGALDALPDLPLDGGTQPVRDRATGTYDDGALAPLLAPDWCKRGQTGANGGKTANRPHAQRSRKAPAASTCESKSKRPLPSTGNDRQNSGRLDSNQRPLDPQSSTLNQAELRPGVIACD